ncbi:uncharacterized protein LOC141665642 [Apium graveolens]|uniref:uncharacterized protein LOC141665642 n=1 Tax=Apium graveolens TaxID=4045 RepID=UPI003D7B9E78
MALDGIVNVNSLFTLALFLGLTFNPSDPSYTLVDSKSCRASTSMAEYLVTFHVYSFSSFLFSSLIASSLKLAIRNAKDGNNDIEVNVNVKILRIGILASAAGSASGCVFLMLALVNLVQIKLGILSCWNWYTYSAIGPLVTLAPLALLIYIGVVLHAFTR